MKRNILYGTLAVAILFSLVCACLAESEREPIVPELTTTPRISASTVPSNGDLNPYGVAFVPHGFPAGGSVNPGDVMVSNFNDSANVQGTGTIIVSISPSGQQSVFFQGQPGLGFTTAHPQYPRSALV